MAAPQLSKAMRRVRAVCRAHGVVRRRGAYGQDWADDDAEAADDGEKQLGRFAASITIDHCLRRGLLRPAVAWGAYEWIGPKGRGAENGTDRNTVAGEP